MTREEFEMNLLIGGWIKKESEHIRADLIYTHNDSHLSIGTRNGSDTVALFQNGGYIGTLHYEDAFNKVNDHMVLMQDLMNGQARVFT